MFLKHQHDLVVFNLRIFRSYRITEGRKGGGGGKVVTKHYPQYLLEWFTPILNRRRDL